MALFYTLNLIVFLIVGDLNGAKFLWKRAPERLKGPNYSLGSVWNIGKLLWNDDIAGALNASKGSWPNDIAVYMKSLSSELLNQQLETFSSAYSVVPLSSVSLALSLSQDDTVQSMCLCLSLVV